MDTEAGARAYGSDGDAAGTGTYRILVAICAVNGACAIALGALMMLAPSGQGWDASIVLALVAGGANAATAAHGARSSSFSGPTSWRRDISSSDCFKRPSPSKCAGDGWGIRSFQAGRRGERAARCGIPRSGNAPDRHFALE